jgi:prophage regulatory protein
MPKLVKGQGGATDRLLRRKEVEHLTGKSRSGIYGDMKSGTFPLAIKIGEKSVAWSELEILDWVSARMARRDAITVNPSVSNF